MKTFWGLQKEDIKNKLWQILFVWYCLGMFCVLFSMKTTLPAGEVRSLYAGPGNTSFLAAMFVFAVGMGVNGFPYLFSERKADLIFSLPFSRKQLFAAGCFNDFMIFAVPAVVCKVVFCALSVSMGYSRYEDAKASVLASCVVLILGFLFVYHLTLLAMLVSQNRGYGAAVLAVFLLGPDLVLYLAERMLQIFIPSFYRSEGLELLKEIFSPVSLIKHAAGTEEYVDGAFWILRDHLLYIGVLAAAVILLTMVNCFLFCKRPVERKRGVFTFKAAEWLFRYGCMTLAVVWFLQALQVFAIDKISWKLVVAAILLGVPLVHGLLNVILSLDGGKFISGKRHLFGGYLLLTILTAVFALAGRTEEGLPKREALTSVAVVPTAMESGADSDAALEVMRVEGEELDEAYDWLSKNCGDGGTYELLVRYDFRSGAVKYRKYEVPAEAMEEFGNIFACRGFKDGMYESLRLEEMKYYEIRWTNGLETYRLDLDEAEKENLLAVCQKELRALSFEDFRQQVPVGSLTFCSTKNQGDVSAYLYPGFKETLDLLEQYGIPAKKGVGDYPITEIIVEKYGESDTLFYRLRSLEWRKEVTDEEAAKELAQALYCEEFCIDPLFHKMNPYLEFTVLFRDSQGKTVNSIACRAPADPGDNEILLQLFPKVNRVIEN